MKDKIKSEIKVPEIYVPFILLMGLLFALPQSAFAQIPDELHGTWVLDEEMSETRMREAFNLNTLTDEFVQIFITKLADKHFIVSDYSIKTVTSEKSEIELVKNVTREDGQLAITTVNQESYEQETFVMTLLEGEKMHPVAERRLQAGSFYWKRDSI